MNTIIEKIRAEVNRLKKQLVRGACAAQIQMETSCKDEAYDEMLSVLSDLEKEEKPTLHEQPVKTDIVEDLKHYLATTPKEQIKKDWESLKEWDKVGPSVSEFLGWKQPICEGLEEEIKRYYDDMDGDCRYAQTARHFYELGCRRTAEKYDEIEYKRQRADVCEGLEEEIEMYFEDWDSNPNGAFFDKEGYKIGIIALKNIARHFAQWGEEHAKEELMKDADKLWTRITEADKLLARTTEADKPSEGLEEEIERYLHSLGVGYGGWVDGMEDDDLRGIARHFARWQKEQMMRSAVEGWVARDGFDNTLCFFSNKPHRPDIQEPLKVWKMWLGGCFHLPKQLFPDLKWEDEPKNVKLIIVKEDEK